MYAHAQLVFMQVLAAVDKTKMFGTPSFEVLEL